jgi:predicted nucleotidyltransferase
MTIQELKDKNLLLLECISGSKAYGLDTATSDTDIKGVYYLPKEQFYGLNYIAQINNDSNDEVYYELGRFVELLSKNNPNILELLATPDEHVLFKHPIMEQLTIDMFLSKQCKDTFAGYAHSQIKKARGYKKKIVNPVDKERKSVLDFCFVLEGYASVTLKEWLTRNQYQQAQCGLTAITHTKGMYALFYDPSGEKLYRGIISGENANEVSLSSILKGEQQIAYLFCNIESYSAYCKEYREYWEWVEKRNEHRYSSNKEHGKDYDAKNMMHTIRLLQVAEEIFRDGKLNVKRENSVELLNIKSGQWEYDELLLRADELMNNIEYYYVQSRLQNEVNMESVEATLIKMRTELYH